MYVITSPSDAGRPWSVSEEDGLRVTGVLLGNLSTDCDDNDQLTACHLIRIRSMLPQSNLSTCLHLRICVL